MGPEAAAHVRLDDGRFLSIDISNQMCLHTTGDFPQPVKVFRLGYSRSLIPCSRKGVHIMGPRPALCMEGERISMLGWRRRSEPRRVGMCVFYRTGNTTKIVRGSRKDLPLDLVHGTARAISKSIYPVGDGRQLERFHTYMGRLCDAFATPMWGPCMNNQQIKSALDAYH